MCTRPARICFERVLVTIQGLARILDKGNGNSLGLEPGKVDIKLRGDARKNDREIPCELISNINKDDPGLEDG